MDRNAMYANAQTELDFLATLLLDTTFGEGTWGNDLKLMQEDECHD
jgi:hypothetical protein